MALRGQDGDSKSEPASQPTVTTIKRLGTAIHVTTRANPLFGYDTENELAIDMDDISDRPRLDVDKFIINFL